GPGMLEDQREAEGDIGGRLLSRLEVDSRGTDVPGHAVALLHLNGEARGIARHSAPLDPRLGHDWTLGNGRVRGNPRKGRIFYIRVYIPRGWMYRNATDGGQRG